MKPLLGHRAEWPIVMMQIAEAAGSRSRDATTRVGTVVCTENWRVLGTGYNGGPKGSPKGLVNQGASRHLFVVHSEINALLQAVAALGSNDLSGCLLFSTHRPCAACLKMASHLGVRRVLYAVDELSPEQRHDAEKVSKVLGIKSAKNLEKGFVTPFRKFPDSVSEGCSSRG